MSRVVGADASEPIAYSGVAVKAVRRWCGDEELRLRVVDGEGFAANFFVDAGEWGLRGIEGAERIDRSRRVKDERPYSRAHLLGKNVEEALARVGHDGDFAKSLLTRVSFQCLHSIRLFLLGSGLWQWVIACGSGWRKFVAEVQLDCSKTVERFKLCR